MESSPPRWWFQKGMKMQLLSEDPLGRVVAITHRACSLEDAVASLVISPDLREGSDMDWRVAWKLRGFVNVDGYVFFTTDMLAAAFGLSLLQFADGEDLVRSHGAHVAVRGKFIRTGPFLTIPNPGDGSWGSASLSLEIDSAIKGAIERLLDGASIHDVIRFEHAGSAFKLPIDQLGAEYIGLGGRTYRVREWLDRQPTGLEEVRSVEAESV